MFRKIKRLTQHIIIGANTATIIIMLLIGFSDRINPETSPMMSNIGLLFPVLLVINFAFLLFWLVFTPKCAVFPVAGYILCFLPVRTYCPLNIVRPAPEDALKVLSFNVESFSVDATDDGAAGNPPAMDYILNSGADIVCLQEANISPLLEKVLGDTYGHMDSVRNVAGGSELVLLSKFPIVGKERIRYVSKGNISAAFFVMIGKDTVTVINNHFETSGLSLDDRDGFRNIIRGATPKDTMRTESKRLIVKLGESAKKRAPQANAVAAFVDSRKGKRVILCGDFNDSPISYTHRTLAKRLTDCYVATGNGPGWSYNNNSMKVRIDNIMCSDDWIPYGCAVDSKIKASDHYPIYCWLKMRDNQ